MAIPSIDEIYQAILNDYATEFEVDVNQLGWTYEVRAKVLAGLHYPIYLYAAAVQRNVFPDLAEISQLIRYGLGSLKRTPAPATAGEYTIEVTGEIGAVITAGTTFKANDNTLAAGFLFVVDIEKTLTATTDTLQVRALTVGTTSVLFIDDLITATAPIADVDSEAKVTVITVQPSAAESIESYRADVVEAAQLEPQGGAGSDYRLWASDVPEVRTVYPYAKLGSAGDINVFIEATKENSAPLETPGVPTQQTINDVYTKQIGLTPESGALVYSDLDQRGRRPMSVFNIFPLPVSPVAVNLFFTDLSDESISDQLRSVIDELLYKIRPFIASAQSLKSKNDILTISQLIATTTNLIAGTGITYSALIMTVGGVGESSHQFFDGDYPFLSIIENNGDPI